MATPSGSQYDYKKGEINELKALMRQVILNRIVARLYEWHDRDVRDVTRATLSD
jgi:hypothetical protein